MALEQDNRDHVIGMTVHTFESAVLDLSSLPPEDLAGDADALERSRVCLEATLAAVRAVMRRPHLEIA